MRMGAAARARARSLDRELILLTRTFLEVGSPSGPLRSTYPGSTPNCVTVGPWLTSTTLAGTPKLVKVSSMMLSLRRTSASLRASSEVFSRRSKEGSRSSFSLTRLGGRATCVGDGEATTSGSSSTATVGGSSEIGRGRSSGASTSLLRLSKRGARYSWYSDAMSWTRADPLSRISEGERLITRMTLAIKAVSSTRKAPMSPRDAYSAVLIAHPR